MKNIIDRIKSYKYVSFDMFDTLILRNVKKTKDIFKIVQQEIDKSGIKINDFVNKRIYAEKEAITEKTYKEITLEEIYSFIQFGSAKDRQSAISIEKDTEIKYSMANPALIPVIKYCKENNKKIIIETDMYLDEITIKKILEKNKVTYDYLYLSSKIKLRKSSGQMFKYVLEDLKISNRELIHIGDNIRSDYILPKSRGITSIIYRRNKQNYYNVENILDNICFSYINNIDIHDNDKYYKFGFKYLGILLYGMCQWIHEQAKIKKIDNIYFLSRDGYIIKKVYDIIYKHESTYYLYVSRRSLTVPMLKDISCIEDIIKTIPYIKRRETVKTLMHKLGIENESIEIYLKNKYGDNINRSDLIAGKYEEFFKDIKGIVEKNSEEEFNNCSGYLKDNFNNDRFMIIDLGWYGTIQKCLENILKESDKKYDILGYYLGVLEKKENSKNSKMMKGYIYDYKSIDSKKYNQKLIFGFNGLIESIFTADHGSVKKYQYKNESYVPVLEEWENKNWNIINKIHQGALDFVKGINGLVDYNGICISKEAAFEGINNIFTNPSRKEVELFQDIIFYDTYYEKLVNYSGILNYIKNYKLMINDFCISNWKIGFLKKLIKLKIPIDKLYLFLVRIRELN